MISKVINKFFCDILFKILLLIVHFNVFVSCAMTEQAVTTVKHSASAALADIAPVVPSDRAVA